MAVGRVLRPEIILFECQLTMCTVAEELYSRTRKVPFLSCASVRTVRILGLFSTKTYRIRNSLILIISRSSMPHVLFVALTRKPPPNLQKFLFLRLTMLCCLPLRGQVTKLL